MISSLPMLVDRQVAFAMFSLCYAQHFGYLLCIMFPSPSILQHYIEFNICIITMLEKLHGVGFFDGSIGHLVHCQAILPTFSNRFNFISIIWIVAFTFLGCWALIAPTLVIHL
jgi:hypothetical protein